MATQEPKHHRCQGRNGLLQRHVRQEVTIGAFGRHDRSIATNKLLRARASLLKGVTIACFQIERARNARNAAASSRPLRPVAFLGRPEESEEGRGAAACLCLVNSIWFKTATSSARGGAFRDGPKAQVARVRTSVAPERRLEFQRGERRNSSPVVDRSSLGDRFKKSSSEL